MHTTSVEKTIAYTNLFGEGMRIPYSPSDYEWRAAHDGYRDVRVEERTVLVEVITTDWKVVK